MRTQKTGGRIEPSTFSPIVEAMLGGVDDGRFDPADTDAADDWAAAVSVFELVAEGKTFTQAVDTFSNTSNLGRSRIEAAARDEFATLGVDDIDSPDGRAAVELYLALMLEPADGDTA
jgi:hypothetical protein